MQFSSPKAIIHLLCRYTRIIRHLIQICLNNTKITIQQAFASSVDILQDIK